MVNSALCTIKTSITVFVILIAHPHTHKLISNFVDGFTWFEFEGVHFNELLHCLYRRVKKRMFSPLPGCIEQKKKLKNQNTKLKIKHVFVNTIDIFLNRPSKTGLGCNGYICNAHEYRVVIQKPIQHFSSQSLNTKSHSGQTRFGMILIYKTIQYYHFTL